MRILSPKPCLVAFFTGCVFLTFATAFTTFLVVVFLVVVFFTATGFGSAFLGAGFGAAFLATVFLAGAFFLAEGLSS